MLGVGFFIIVVSAGVVSCTSPQAIATFAEAADKALDEGPPIFRDLHDSCVRRHVDAQPITPVFLPRPESNAGSMPIDEAAGLRPIWPPGRRS